MIQNLKNRFPLVGETTMVVLVEGSLDNYETSGLSYPQLNKSPKIYATPRELIALQTIRKSMEN